MNRLKQRTASDLCVVRTVFRAEVSPGTGGEGLDRDGDVRRHLRLGYHRLLLLLCSPRRKRETSRISNEQQHAQKITESFQASELQGRVMVGGRTWEESVALPSSPAAAAAQPCAAGALRLRDRLARRRPLSVIMLALSSHTRLQPCSWFPRHQPIGQTQTMHKA